MAAKIPMAVPLYNRLISYLHYMKQLPQGGAETISSTVIAAALRVNDVQVRKDLALASNRGKPKIGYITKELIADLEHFLGHDTHFEAVLAGVGNLGKALLSYHNFRQYGLKIIAAFDSDPQWIGRDVSGIPILDAEQISQFCKEKGVRIGIISVPAGSAQSICEQLISGGIRAVWNFAPTHLTVPETVIVKNEDMAASLAILTRQLENNMQHYATDENRRKQDETQ